MSPEEMSRFVMHLMEQLDAIREELRVSNAEQQPTFERSCSFPYGAAS